MKIPNKFYVAFGFVLGCYATTLLYLYYGENGVWGLCGIGTIGLLAGIYYYHSKQYIYSPELPIKTKKIREKL